MTRPGVLILVQNLPVPFDRRVWQEACALRDEGYDVSVVCPSSTQHPALRETLEGIEVFRYRPRYEARRLLGYVVEYGVALTSMSVLAWKAAAGRRVDVVQACNPPDLLFLAALPLVLLRRARFLFDHHDLSPELLVSKGFSAASWPVRLVTALERTTFGLATVSIATNESYRDVAVRRGGLPAERVFTVRSGPDHRFRPVEPDDRLRAGRRHLVGYVGVMGIQDGLDLLLAAADVMINQRGRDDTTFALAGDGPEGRRLRERARELGLSDHVHFLGRVSDADLLTLLSTADVCVNPDEVNALNDVSTMNKIVEYMALGRPVVQFETREGRVSAGSSALYPEPNDPVAFADAICTLLDDPDRRAEMGAQGRLRYEEELAWSRQVPHLLAAYRTALSVRRSDIGVLRASWWRGRRRAAGSASEARGSQGVLAAPRGRGTDDALASVGPQLAS